MGDDRARAVSQLATFIGALAVYGFIIAVARAHHRLAPFVALVN